MYISSYNHPRRVTYYNNNISTINNISCINGIISITYIYYIINNSINIPL